MKKIELFILALLCSIFPIQAQSSIKKGLATINQYSAKAYIGFLSSDAMQGREAGTNHGRIAAEYIASNLQVLGIRPLSDSYLQPFEACAKERQQKSRFQIHPDSIALIKKGVHRILLLNNVLGKIEGKNPNEFVVIGAHYDHLGIDPTLEGDCIYNGADDNASGVSAVLQVAKAFIASGIQPERTVIFAFWDGEEKGLLGSQYFCLSFPKIKKVKAYLNYDMIGRNNQESRPTQFVYFYTKSHPIFGEWLKKDIENYQLHLTPDYHPWDKPVGGSDNSSFAKLDIPIIWYHTDGHPDYHQPSDQIEKLNWDKLLNITEASFINMWNLANEKDY